MLHLFILRLRQHSGARVVANQINPSAYTIAASTMGKLNSQNTIKPRAPGGVLACVRTFVCI